MGPKERAGLIPQPVKGMRMMWASMTEKPIARGAALPAVELELTAEFSTVITKRYVPMSSKRKAAPTSMRVLTVLRPMRKAGP